MKKLTIVLTLSAALAQPVFAAEGCAKTGWRPFDEDVNGNNCPATEVEKNMGGIIMFVLIAGIIGTATGKISFPVGG